MLFLLYPRLPAAHIVGTDLSYAVPLAMLAGLRHFYFWERWMRHCYALPAWNLARLPYWDRNSEAGAATDSGEHIGFNWGQIDLIW